MACYFRVAAVLDTAVTPILELTLIGVSAMKMYD